MHVATKQHIVGMLTMIRQACHSIEAAIAADDHRQGSGVSTSKVGKDSSLESEYLTHEQEDTLAKMLGLDDEDKKAP